MADGLSVWLVCRSEIPCRTACGIRLLAGTVSDNLWRHFIQRIRGFTTMHYINRLFTYLLTQNTDDVTEMVGKMRWIDEFWGLDRINAWLIAVTVGFPSGRLEKTTRSSPHHVAQHRPTGSETTPSYAPQSSRFGSEPPSVEDDVDVWRYAIVSCMPETTTTTTVTTVNWRKGNIN